MLKDVFFVIKNSHRKIGWKIQLKFQINLHEKDKALLEKIKDYFLVGGVFKESGSTKTLKYCVFHKRVLKL